MNTAHGTVSQQNRAVIRLDHIRKNARLLRAKAHTELCAVVKADGYGHGAAEVARALSGVARMFAVALVEEGAALRLSCPSDILVLVPPLSEEEAMRGICCGLIFSVGDAADAALLSRAAQKLGQTARCHLKVNTGMNRFGFDLSDFSAFCRSAKPKRLRIEGIYSHFYKPHGAAETQAQFRKFQVFSHLAESEFGALTKHIAATGGILASCEYALDMVRPGIGLYGYLPEGFRGALPLKKAMRVYANAVCGRRYAGGGAGYGAYTGGRGGWLSAGRCGYADGFFRSGGEGVVNSLCMDACLYAEKLEKYGEVCVLSDADEYAGKHGTISYEVLAGAGRRAVWRCVG